MRTRIIPRLSEADVARFWSAVAVAGPDDCWLWTRPCPNQGYGMFSVNKRLYLAHRVSFVISVGVIPPGFFVCHACDSPACVNPEHLFIGKQRQNMDDMKAKRRAACGERSGNSRWTAADVLRVRRLWDEGKTSPEIAAITGIPVATVWPLATRRAWRHLAEEAAA